MLNAMRDIFSAFRWIFHRKLIFLSMIPAILGALLFSGIYMVVTNLSDDLSNWMWAWYSWDWGRGLIDQIGPYLSGAIMIAMSLFVFKYLILIVSSPFMSVLSERLENILTDESQVVPASTKELLEGFVRGVRLSLRNMSRELLLTILLLLLSFIPLFAPFTSILIVLTQAYFAGFGNMDFTMERYFSKKEAVVFVRRYKFYAIGNGLVFLGLLAIPILGPMLAVPLCSAGGTLGVLDRT